MYIDTTEGVVSGYHIKTRTTHYADTTVMGALGKVNRYTLESVKRYIIIYAYRQRMIDDSV
jgi:hypothetical protein